MKKSSQVKKLQKQLENLWKQYCYQRDGKQCKVKENYPGIKTKHSEIFQVDHFFSRNNKELFTEVANGTVVCSYCNNAKRYNDAIRLALQDIVVRREGIHVFNRMREIVSSRRAFDQWKDIEWLNAQIKILTEMTADLVGLAKINKMIEEDDEWKKIQSRLQTLTTQK